jgi:hypothetical protein
MVRMLVVVSVVAALCAGCKKGEELMYPTYTPPPASTAVPRG